MPAAPPGPSRRGLLSGAVLLAAAAGCGPVAEPVAEPAGDAVGDAAGPYPERPGRQAGVTTPQPDSLLLAAYDLAPGVAGPEGAGRLRELLARWPGGPPVIGATATVGIGPALPGRLGLRTPEGLAELPAFPGDRLDPARCGGDLVVQLCAPDVWTVVTAAAGFDRAVRGLLTVRWRRSGFQQPVARGETPRNLFGFKDGTVNPDPGERERWVWLTDGPDRDGTYLVVRQIRMLTEEFARLPGDRREAVVGRRLDSGAALGRSAEHEEPDLFAKAADGRYLLPADSHVRLAHSRLDGGARMLRRGYSYADGPEEQGLVFLAFMRDPALFVRVQERLAGADAMNAYLEHRGSAVFHILPGALPGRPLGSALFGGP
ncbi:Dyp-type peroxidase [Kitasatospora sp. NPDC002040]|uniref:Dyp-type peroxidase n=1 Tax=Kitasatospora sp. NPDC002040 TaxID=3154661 RepID=UPI00331C9262